MTHSLKIDHVSTVAYYWLEDILNEIYVLYTQRTQLYMYTLSILSLPRNLSHTKRNVEDLLKYEYIST